MDRNELIEKLNAHFHEHTNELIEKLNAHFHERGVSSDTPGPIIRRAPRTMEEVRLYGKGTDTVVCFRDNINKAVSAEKLRDLYDILTEEEARAAKAEAERDPVFEAIEAKVRSVLTDEEYNYFIRNTQWTVIG